MTRRGAHKGGFNWGGGGIDVGRQRYNEIMGALIVCESDLKKLEAQLSHWPHGRDFAAVREALNTATRLHRSAQYNGGQAKKFQLVRATYLARKNLVKASRIQTLLSSILQDAPW
jgi:hypothetical protein